MSITRTITRSVVKGLTRSPLIGVVGAALVNDPPDSDNGVLDSLAITLSSAAVAGNLLVVGHATANETPALPTDDLASDAWTELAVTTGVQKLGVYYKIAEGGEAIVTLNLAGAEGSVGIIYELEGPWLASPVVDSVIRNAGTVSEYVFDLGAVAGPGAIISFYANSVETKTLSGLDSGHILDFDIPDVQSTALTDVGMGSSHLSIPAGSSNYDNTAVASGGAARRWGIAVAFGSA